MADARNLFRMTPLAAFAGTVQSPEREEGVTESLGFREFSRRGTMLRLRNLVIKQLRPRPQPEFGIPEAISLLIFCSVLFWCIPHHESWFDEAQAWLIARDSTLSDLFIHRLHYEGSPGLWHLLLWLEYRLHVTLLGMHLVTGAIAVAGMFVWLRFNTLPRIISLLLPLTFFFQYQYAVVARSYVLCPLLAFSLMALYGNRKSSPLWFGILAGLLANCSLHMAALSAGLAVLYVHDRMPFWKEDPTHVLRRLALPTVILVVLFAASAATAMPTADGSSTTANPIVSAIRKVFAAPAKSASIQTPSVDWANPGELQPVAPHQGRVATYVWHLIHTPPNATAKARLAGGITKHMLVFLTATTVPISTSNLLALIFLFLLIANLVRTRLLLSLLPYALVQVCNVLISGEAHHLGLLWIALVCSLWALCLGPSPLEISSQWRQPALFAVTLLVVVLQVGWSVDTVRADVNQPYASSEAAAAFIHGLPKGTRIAAFDDDSVTVNAYLAQSPYFNQKVDYWPFSRTKDPDITLEQTMAQRPDMVVLKMASPDAPITNQWVILSAPGTILIPEPTLRAVLAANYRETHRFCGRRFFRNGSESTDCRLFFEPADKFR